MTSLHHVFNFQIYARPIDGGTSTTAGFVNTLMSFVQDQEHFLLQRRGDDSSPIHEEERTANGWRKKVEVVTDGPKRFCTCCYVL